MLSTIINQQLCPHIHLHKLCRIIPFPSEKRYIWSVIFEHEHGKKVKHIPFINYIPSVDKNKTINAYIKLSTVLFKICMYEHNAENIECIQRIEIIEYIRVLKDTLYKSIMDNDYPKHIFEISRDINLYIAESHPECLIYKNQL